MRIIIFAIFLFIISPFADGNVTLKNRLIKSNVGDFIVTEQGSNYSLLLIRLIEKNLLVLEEISIEQSLVDLDKVSWKKWIEKKAPGAFSWTSFVIDLEKNTLTQCFSHFQKQWIFIEKSDYYFAQLLTLSLHPSQDNERKRIGPAPLPGEADRRKLWQPQMTREGKKIKNPHFEVLRVHWPNDKTRLAGSILELYLDAEQPHFPFPYWMEIQSPHYTFKIRAVDSGTGIQSPMPLIK